MKGYRASDEVAAALGQGRVVALESSIICQGMPWPTNLETARAMEEAIREEGAVPATIAVVEGEVRVGLSSTELEELARRREAIKVGLRDLPYAELKGLTGGTTVSGTMAIAQEAGIRVFATGGIGGVHRGTFGGAHGGVADISSDLTALSRFDVIVVCSGAKAFLDLGNTLEVLETLGVPVIGFGTDDFPGFYLRTTGFKVPFRLDEPVEVVRFARTKWERRLEGGVVVANPIPPEKAGDERLIADALGQAVMLAGQQGIKGKAVTPFILDQLRRMTGGESLRANVALAVANARLGGRLAREWAAGQ